MEDTDTVTIPAVLEGAYSKGVGNLKPILF